MLRLVNVFNQLFTWPTMNIVTRGGTTKEYIMIWHFETVSEYLLLTWRLPDIVHQVKLICEIESNSSRYNLQLEEILLHLQ